MKKILIVMLLVGANAYAGSYPVPSPAMQIITPDVAVGHYKFEHHAVTVDGQIVVCPANASYEWRRVLCTGDGRNRWTLMRDAVPKGRTFVGYSVEAYNNRIFVYWK